MLIIVPICVSTYLECIFAHIGICTFFVFVPFMNLYLFEFAQSARARFIWESVPCQKSPGEHMSFKCFTGQVKSL